MRGSLAVLVASLGLSIVPASQAAEVDTVKIIIAGGDSSTPIEITDPAALAEFNVGAGPGHTLWLNPEKGVPIVVEHGFIIDWKRGEVAPPQGLKTYKVSFATTRPDPGTYVVRYAIDPTTNLGYVYLPGKGDPGYQDDVSFILRGVEGNWFHAWSEWEKVANPLIAGVLEPEHLASYTFFDQVLREGPDRASPLVRRRASAKRAFFQIAKGETIEKIYAPIEETCAISTVYYSK